MIIFYRIYSTTTTHYLTSSLYSLSLFVFTFNFGAPSDTLCILNTKTIKGLFADSCSGQCCGGHSSSEKWYSSNSLTQIITYGDPRVMVLTSTALYKDSSSCPRTSPFANLATSGYSSPKKLCLPTPLTV